MTTTTIITICLILLLAYIFDLTSSKTKIPSVILLLILGFGLKYLLIFLGIKISHLDLLLPTLGTVGLILIVLEGSLELEVNRSKLGVILKASLMAFLSITFISFILALAFYHFYSISLEVALSNSIPFAIISSAIAIPSARNLLEKDKEFITYESSLSDIFGVIFFNSIINSNDIFQIKSAFVFSKEIILILLVTGLSTLFLTYFLKKVKHNIKFIPIILVIVLVYFLCKLYHLPGLIFILLFGLFIGNIDHFRQLNFFKMDFEVFKDEIYRFKELTTEFAFLVRVLFFLVFGFLIEKEEVLNTHTIYWAIVIVCLIFSSRIIFLKIFKQQIFPLLFMAPRGLITILLFLYIPLERSIEINNRSLITQVIILTAIIMVYGSITSGKKNK